MDYRDSGVDISAADTAKARIKGLARGTFNPGVLSEIGSFGGMFRPDLSRYREPVLVASTDGVGTQDQGRDRRPGVHDTVGYDLVAHCVNDILVQGALPLFFLDYVAVGRMDPERSAQIVSGVSRACREFGCPLIGGETAEMPDTYAEDDYDLAGFIVGVVERDKALTGARVQAGDVLWAALQRPPHQRLLAGPQGASRPARSVRDSHVPELGTTVGERPLAPHRSYLEALGPLLERGRIRALAHITGRRLPGNIPRVLPAGLARAGPQALWEVPRPLQAHPAGRRDPRGGHVPHVQHGYRHDRGGGPRDAARGRALAAAARRGAPP